MISISFLPIYILYLLLFEILSFLFKEQPRWFDKGQEQLIYPSVSVGVSGRQYPPGGGGAEDPGPSRGKLLALSQCRLCAVNGDFMSL